MEAFLDSLNGIEWVFFPCAVLGSALFVVRLLLMMVSGLGGDTELHADHGDGMDGHTGHDGHGDSSLKLLSFQGLMAFFMMFGLTGLGCTRGGNLGLLLSLLTALVVGLAAAWCVAALTGLMLRMQSSGTLDLYNALGQEGKVYLTIPPEKTGKVQIVVQDRLMVLDAVSTEPEEIKTGEVIRVVNLSGTSTLVVEKANPGSAL